MTQRPSGYRDWGGYGTILNNPPIIQDRVDCPVCGEVLHSNGRVWSCPRQGAKHYQAPELPRD